MPASRVWSRLAICLSLTLVGATGASVLAQDGAWRHSHDKGTRYEGLVSRPNARRDYEVLGLFAGKKPGKVSASTRLHIKYFVPPHEAVASIKVAELRSETLYLMEPKPEQLQAAKEGAWNSFDDWPAGEVIVPSHVDVENLGVLVRLNDGGRADVLAPALVYASESPVAIDTYTVDFVSHKRLKGVTCVVLDGKGVQRKCTVPGNVVDASVPVEFHVDATALNPGRATVRIEGEYANTMGERLIAELYFTHEKLTH